MSGRYAALLRAVNVGGRQLAMADLRRVAADCGFTAPETLLASGNLLFETRLGPDPAGETLRLALLRTLNLTTDVFVRDNAQLAAVITGNPFPDAACDQPSRLVVMFLDQEPQAQLDVLAPACGLGEEVRTGPDCLYLWLPQGAGTTRLTNTVIERRLGVRGTVRNWNTVGKLYGRLRANS